MKISLFSCLSILVLIAQTACAQAIDPNKARIARFDGDRPAAITYTFDDNLRDQYTVAVPMLNESGLKGTFFVIPGLTAETVEEGEKKQKEKRAWGGVTWAELKKMDEQGHEIASHTWSHPNLSKMKPEEVDEQLSKAYEAIKMRIGKAPLTLAFPFNSSTPEVRAAALKYHVAYRSYQTGTSDKSTAESLNAWADNLVKDKKWGIIMAHGISTGYAALSDPEILRAHFKYVKSHEREIWVDTFANVSRYQKERDDAKLVYTEKGGVVVSCTVSSSLDPQIYNVPLTIVIDAAGATSASATREGKELPVRVENGSIYIAAAPGTQSILIVRK